jgi:predicted dehydrogenase
MLAGGTVLAGGMLAGNIYGGVPGGRPVRLGVIGVGGRGVQLMMWALKHPEVQVNAICDINKKHLNRALNIVKTMKGNSPAGYSADELDYRNMLQRNDIDAVLIATSIQWHARMSMDAMNAGKHVGCEVPACATLEECHGLVEAKERNGVHYFMMENYMYMRNVMAVFNMVNDGVLGNPYYAECGYIHEFKGGYYNSDGTVNWRGELITTDYGNYYPTHSSGPVFKWMGVNAGDRLERLTCYSTLPNQTAYEFYAERFGEDRAKEMQWTAGEMTTCLVKTAKGKVIKIDFDCQSNRPHSFYYLLQGTKGIYDNRFGISLKDPTQQSGHLKFEWQAANPVLGEYDHPLWKKHAEEALKTKHGGGDYFTVRDFVNMVKYDREPWVDVYDAAAWSAIYPCSKQSLDQNNAAVEIPDFTSGKWKQKDWRPQLI